MVASINRGRANGSPINTPIRFLSKPTGYGQAAPSPGQSTPLPVQCAAPSQSPADARQTVAADWKPSAGQLALLPVQFSAASHGPAAARQTVAADWKPSAGQLALLPVQFSAASH